VSANDYPEPVTAFVPYEDVRHVHHPI
jgi:hypothetical protein